ncbi:MAG: AmmeMemoRadiSam system radical SAM enzyme [Chloroflexi bacterium]|nr:AmmeMemoRadiSam system radical SAM enzyme [Chloroflexota bacterium]
MPEKNEPIRRTDRVQSDLMPELAGLRQPLAGDVPVSKIIDRLVVPGELYEALEGDKVHCYACGHHCKIKPGARGICQVRYNIGGKLYVPWGYVAALQCDPTEKKPFYHVYPGSDTLTFGMLGCDLHCSYCHNWDTSQALRDVNAGRPPAQITPEEMVDMAKRNGAKCLASSYNEPLITSEWARAIFEQAKQEDFTCLYISNGNATREVLEYIRPYTDGYKIDLKTMNDKSYRQLGAVLEHILDGIRMVHEMGFWMEIVTLIVPGFNDSPDELRDAARFLRSISPDIPWHVTAFYPNYKMMTNGNTQSDILIRAAEIGYEEGLNYVYAGNRAGQVQGYENTRCPNCQKTLIERFAYVILDYQITPEGTCPDCSTSIAGMWPSNPKDVRIGTVDSLFSRRPRAVR